jgi:hypothetical protein
LVVDRLGIVEVELKDVLIPSEDLDDGRLQTHKIQVQIRDPVNIRGSAI